MSELLDTAINGPVSVLSAVAVWLLSYWWLNNRGAEALSDLLKGLLLSIPPLSISVLLIAVAAEALENGWSGLLAILLLTTGGVFALFWTVLRDGEKRGFLRQIWNYRKTKRSLREAAWKVFPSLIAIAAGAVGVLAGYQLAFDSVSGGIALFVLAGVLAGIAEFALRWIDNNVLGVTAQTGANDSEAR